MHLLSLSASPNKHIYMPLLIYNWFQNTSIDQLLFQCFKQVVTISKIIYHISVIQVTSCFVTEQWHTYQIWTLCLVVNEVADITGCFYSNGQFRLSTFSEEQWKCPYHNSDCPYLNQKTFFLLFWNINGKERGLLHELNIKMKLCKSLSQNTFIIKDMRKILNMNGWSLLFRESRDA